MFSTGSTDIAQFFVVGINYKKTDAAIRGLFSINNDQYSEVLTIAKEIGLRELFILSTCNRTEVYGFASNAAQLIQLLCTHTEGTRELFEELSYIKNGEQAIRHLFHVGAGLDSQILGDYEIIGQIKSAAKFSKKHSSLVAFMECSTPNFKAYKKSNCIKRRNCFGFFCCSAIYQEHQEETFRQKDIVTGCWQNWS